MSDKELDDDILDEIEEDEDDFDRGDEVEEDEDQEDDVKTEEEDEEDDLEDQEDEEEEEDEEDEEDEDEPISIPKSRLDAVIAQREAEKERTLWLESQLEKLINQSSEATQKKEVKEAYDFSSAEMKYADLLIEGDTSKAASLRAEIDTERKQEMLDLISSIKEESKNEAISTSSKAIDDQKFDTLVDNYENKHPFLDVESDHYNEEAIETVNTLIAAYIASGTSRNEALSLAVKKVVPIYKPSLKNTSRKKASIKRAASASKRQPPRSKGRTFKNIDREELSVADLSERDFSKLTNKEKRVLRGD